MLNICWPCWIAITRRVANRLPSQARSTSYTMGELKSPRRKKYACSECTISPVTVADAAIDA